MSLELHLICKGNIFTNKFSHCPIPITIINISIKHCSEPIISKFIISKFPLCFPLVFRSQNINPSQFQNWLQIPIIYPHALLIPAPWWTSSNTFPDIPPFPYSQMVEYLNEININDQYCPSNRPQTFQTMGISMSKCPNVRISDTSEYPCTNWSL